MKKEDLEQLLKKAELKFIFRYGKSPEEMGMNCCKIWFKPIVQWNLRLTRFPEAVFGTEEKEVDALIKVQKLIRWWCFVFTPYFLLALPALLILSGWLGGLAGMCYLMSGVAALSFVFMGLRFYVKPYEKLYEGKNMDTILLKGE